jgi:hypothetical protein
MRWDDLFADLAGQLEAGLGAERAELVAELTRAEGAGIALADRCRAHRGALRLSLVDGEVLTGEVTDAGPDWLLVSAAPHEHLVPLSAVASAAGLTERAAASEGVPFARLGITSALRALARDRQVVRVVALGTELVGMVAAVGADHLDVAPIASDTMRPTGDRVTVPLRALVRVSHT